MILWYNQRVCGSLVLKLAVRVKGNIMKNRQKGRISKAEKLELAISEEIAYDEDETYPDKYELNEDLISGDEYGKKTVIDTYKNMDSMYGIFRSSHSNMLAICIAVLALMNVASLTMLIASLVRKSSSTTIVVAFIIEAGFVFLTYKALKFVIGKKFEIYMYREDGKNIIVYKNVKKDICVVYTGKKQIYLYEYEEWHPIYLPYHVGGRLLFQYLCGQLMVYEHSNGIVEIYCRNRAFFEFRRGGRYQKSADMLIKNGKPWRINYYNETFPDGSGRARSTSSEQIEFVEINTARVAEIPKSFLDFCEKEGIEPLKENEHMRYV